MKFSLDLNKSLHKNISEHYEKSKRAKEKAKRIENAINEMEKKIQAIQKKKETEKIKPVKKRTLEWYEKFRWFFSSDGFLIIAGRDAKTNETIVKKYMSSEDIYFHADIQGAAHCIIKTNNQKVPMQTLQETSVFAAACSKAWQQGLLAIDVYSVKPEQVSKSAPSGESIGTGAFMIYGKRNWFKNTKIDFAIGIEKYKDQMRVISGPPTAIEKKSELSFKVAHGKKKKSEAAKQLALKTKQKLDVTISLDEIIRMLPADNIELK